MIIMKDLAAYTLSDEVRPSRRDMNYGMPFGYTLSDEVRPSRRDMNYGMPFGYGKRKYRHRCFLLVLLAAISACMLSGCLAAGSSNGLASDSQETESRNNGDSSGLRIVTTIFPQYDFVRQIAGERVSLQMLLKPGEETHSYEPTPRDIIAIQNADLFIYVGGENDDWVEDILDAPEMKQVKRLRLTDCVENLKEEHVEGMRHKRQICMDTEEEEETDEHVWTSPKNAMQISIQIKEALSALDPAGKEEYEANLSAYLEQLSALDGQFREITQKAAGQERHLLLFGDRFPFRYLAREYGLDYYAAFPGCASDTEPSAAVMAFLIRKMREEKIPVVLKMELSSDQIAHAVAEASGAEVRVLYSCHNLTVQQFEEGETYVSMMQENVETLKAALMY